MQNSDMAQKVPPKRLYRSRVNRMIVGVCGGLAEYSNIDATLVRILFVILGLMGGSGIIIYIIGVIIIPENPNQPVTVKKKKERDHSIFWGSLLIVLGAFLLLNQMNFIPPIHVWALPWNMVWAILLIALGAFLVLKNSEQKAQTPVKKEESESGEEPKDAEFSAPTGKTLFRSKKDRMIAGVCGGLAEYFNMDPTIVRLLYILLTMFSKGLGVLAYIILIFAVPEEKDNEV